MFYSKDFHDAAQFSAETFLPVAGFDDYEVSNLGRVLSHKGKCPVILKATITPRGYPHVALYRDGKQYRRYNHRLVLEAFEGACPVGYEVRHLDGDPTNAKLSNLVYSTHRENVADRLTHGTNIPRPRLTDDQALDILMTASRETIREQAERLCVAPWVVDDLRQGRTYRHVAPELPRGVRHARRNK